MSKKIDTKIVQATGRPVVFLDVDDVLAINPQYNTRQVLAALTGDETVDAALVWQKVFHGSAKQNLQRLHDEFEPQYVISSSWTLHLSKEQLCSAFLMADMQFVVDNLHEQWCTPRDGSSFRLSEIEAWLGTHNAASQRPFLILDDLLSGQSIVGSRLENYAAICDAWVGLTHHKLRTAQRVLREQLKAMDSN